MLIHPCPRPPICVHLMSRVSVRTLYVGFVSYVMFVGLHLGIKRMNCMYERLKKQTKKPQRGWVVMV